MIGVTTTGKISASTRLALVVLTNGGSLKVEVKAGSSWVLVEEFTQDAAVGFTTGNVTYKITPSGGATYSIGGSVGSSEVIISSLQTLDGFFIMTSDGYILETLQ